MQEHLRAGKVYSNTLKYIASHLFAFIFLVCFYYLGSLLPILIGTTSFKFVLIPYYFLLLYFAAGFYYKHQILLDWTVFQSAILRFFVIALLFTSAILLTTFGINLILDIIKHAFVGGNVVVHLILKSLMWNICKYTVIFLLVVFFIVIPSFSFLSEITGKNRSILGAYAKTKGNFFSICAVVLAAFILIICILLIFAFFRAGLFVSAIPFAFTWAFISILYFKMYDFFYRQPSKKSNNEKAKKDVHFDVMNKIKTFIKKAFEYQPSQGGENKNANQG